LRAFEDQELEEPAIVSERHAPLDVVIADVQRRLRPGTSLNSRAPGLAPARSGGPPRRSGGAPARSGGPPRRSGDAFQDAGLAPRASASTIASAS
jgi:hypothetical protein